MQRLQLSNPKKKTLSLVITLTFHGFRIRNFLLEAGGINKCDGTSVTRSALYPVPGA
jgi:hypothetical protein